MSDAMERPKGGRELDIWEDGFAEGHRAGYDLARRAGAASPGERGPSLPPQTYEDGFRECRVAAECCVEAEEELSGPMPEAMLSALRERPEDVLRATVRTWDADPAPRCKKCGGDKSDANHAMDDPDPLAAPREVAPEACPEKEG